MSLPSMTDSTSAKVICAHSVVILKPSFGHNG
jgi:hypothetical protein